jgi:hypothetical protein
MYNNSSWTQSCVNKKTSVIHLTSINEGLGWLTSHGVHLLKYSSLGFVHQSSSFFLVFFLVWFLVLSSFWWNKNLVFLVVVCFQINFHFLDFFVSL